ncbi:MAG: flavin oxidoreductase [Paramuribaculum sp.]|nr:flavin oxidoreductase [Paramuribaculum sp.]
MRLNRAFTLSIGTVSTMLDADYFGIVSGRKVRKIEHLGLTVTPAEKVNAPIIDIFPLTMECEIVSMTENGDSGVRVVGRVVRTVADPAILDGNGKVDYTKLSPVMYDSETHSYFSLGRRVGRAFHEGTRLK